VSTFTEAELRAAVEAAENWGTYVAAHAFTPQAIQRALAAGVKCIEHGFLMDEATARLIADKGVWLSLQPLPDELRRGFPEGSVERDGIIPESEEVLRASNVGSPVTLSNPASAPARAYLNAASRLMGEMVPMTIPSDRKGLFDKLFGRRRAA
jgi:imidazolonepropionase-like amidohydrolase